MECDFWARHGAKRENAPGNLRMVMDDSVRIYRIKDSLYFRTGRLPDGRQVLVGRQGEEGVIVVFSADGALLGTETERIGAGPLDIPDPALDAVFDRVQARPMAIQVREFSVPERSIRVQDLPDYLLEFVHAPDSFAPAERDHLSGAIEQWEKRGQFVLIWHEDYEMTAEGDIEST
jgi:hypothetical protein